LTLKKQSNRKKIKNIKKKYVTVRVSKKSVATVKITKKSGKVTGFKVKAKKAGKATITIKVKSGIYKGTYKCKVTVKKKPVKKKPKATKKPAATQQPTKAPSAPTEKPIAKNKLAISVMDENGNPLGGASITILKDDAIVKEEALPVEQAVYQTELEKGQYTAKVAKAGYNSFSSVFVIPGLGTETITFTANLQKDTTAPKITDAKIEEKGTAIYVYVDKAVAAADSASLLVTDEQGKSMDMTAPSVTADGHIIKVATTDGKKLPDGTYIIGGITGIADLAGNALTGSISVPKKTTYEKIEITSTGFAPSAGQSVAYKIIDIYGGEYSDVSELNLPNAKDLKVQVSVSNLGLDGESFVPILIRSTENSFDLSTMKKGCKIAVKVEIPELSLTSDTKTVEIGDPAEATSFVENGALTIKQESGVGTGKYTVDYGTESNPIRLGKDASRKAKIQLLMRDQYGNIMQSTKGQVVTLTSGDNTDVIAIKGEDGKESNLVRTVGTEDNTTLWNQIAIKGIGTTTLWAYLDNGQKTPMEVTVKPPKLQGITTNVSVSPMVKEEINILASYFRFDYDEDKKGEYKTPASDLKLSCKKATNGATGDDILPYSSVEPENDPTAAFTGLKIKAMKPAVYTMTLTSENENQSVDFKVSVAQDEEIFDIQLDKASLDIKKGGKAKSVKLNFINKYGDVIAPKACKDMDGIIGFKLYQNNGNTAGIANPENIVTHNYLKDDGTVADINDGVTGLSLSYKKDVPGNYMFEVYLKDDESKKAIISLHCSVATAASISFNDEWIRKIGKLIANDATTIQHIPLVIKDEDGEPMAAQAVRDFSVTATDSSNPDNKYEKGDGFVDIVPAKIQDGKIVTSDITPSDNTFDALEVNPSVIKNNRGAVTYDVIVEYGTGREKITSQSISVKVNHIRRLNKVDITPSSIIFAGRNNKGTATVTAFDQYGDKLAIDGSKVTLIETTSSKGQSDAIATSKCEPQADGTGLVTLTSGGTGKVTKDFEVTHSASDNGTGTDIAVSVVMNIEVKNPSEITEVTVDNDRVLLHRTDFAGDNWNQITLNLTAKDKAGNKMVIGAKDVTFECTDGKVMPDYIEFDKEGGTIKVDTNKLASATDVNIPVKISTAEHDGIGHFTIEFVMAKPTPADIKEKFDDALYSKPLTVKNDGVPVDISNKPFMVKTSYGDEVSIIAKDLQDFKSYHNYVYVEQDKIDKTVTVRVDQNAVKDDTAKIDAFYVENGVRKKTTFTVTVAQRSEEPSKKKNVTINMKDKTSQTGVQGIAFKIQKHDAQNNTDVDVDGASGTTDNDGSATVSLENGDYTVVLTSSGYTVSGSASFTVDENTSTPIEITVENDVTQNEKEVTIKMKDKTSQTGVQDIAFKIQKHDAQNNTDVDVDGASGTTDSDGSAKVSLENGDYTVVLTSSGYTISGSASFTVDENTSTPIEITVEADATS